ncbi:MAG TPA: thioredoxin family protein [Treponemataceae bacterium]|nr:thioredoxin family protein [Treponemataceae bacterium]
MKKQLVTAIALVALTLVGCATPQKTWITDLDQAKMAAEKSKKDLLIAFTGSDWNDPSKELITNVFTDEFFKKGSKKHVLCNIDVVQDETLMDPALIEKNYGIAMTYGVQGLPFFVLQTSTGEIFASGAIEATSTEEFFNFIGSFTETRNTIVALKKKISSSKGIERAKNIDAFIDVVNPSQRQDYADLIREIPTLDADGSAGLKGEYMLQVAYLDALSLYQAQNLTAAGDCFFGITDSESLSPAQNQEAWYMGAYMYAMSETVENEKVIQWLEKAIASDPENQGAPQIQATIDQIKASPEGSSPVNQ